MQRLEARQDRHYFPRMQANDWGRVIFIASESALVIPGEMIHYGMTTTAQLAIARGLATAGSPLSCVTLDYTRAG